MIPTILSLFAKGQLGASQFNNFNVAAPGAAQTLAQISGLAPGLYLAEAWVYFSVGAPAAADVLNMQLQAGAAALKIPAPAVLNGAPVYVSAIYAISGALTTVAITTVGAATAGVTYTGTMSVTRIL